MKRFMAILFAMLFALTLICTVSGLERSIGDSGDDIWEMKAMLRDIGYRIDNNHHFSRRFSYIEQQSLMEFQADVGLWQTGRCDILTRCALERVHASRFDKHFGIFHRNCAWRIDEEANEMKFLCVLKREESFADYDSLTMCCYCEDAEGNRIGTENGAYFSQTSKISLENTHRTNWCVFENADQIDKVFVAVRSLNAAEGASLEIPDDELHFVEYRIR